MRIALLFLFAFTSSLLIAQDSCEDAVLITAGEYTAEIIFGEIPSPVCSTGGDVASGGQWYTYIAPANYEITVSSSFDENTGSFGIDTRLQVYSGECGNLTCLGGDDDSGMETTSIVVVNVLMGETIYIAWDDAFSEEGFIFEIIEGEYIEPVLPPVTFTPVTVGGTGSHRAIVDMNGDYLDDIVRVSGEEGITIAYQTEDGELNTVSIGNSPAMNYPSWSLTAGDIDGNGYNDLVYGGGNGVSFMYANDDGTDYNEITGEEYVFSQRGNCVDIDNDGNLDVFMCHDVQPNVYYTNDGSGNLSFTQGGLGDVTNGGNYGSIWIDYDTDGDTDLFIAKCRGGNSPAKINQMHRNNGDGTYTDVSVELGLDDSVQTWSSAWGDYDNDGDLDIFIGASSFTDGSHKLLRNDGDGVFVDVTEGSGIEQSIGQGNENVTHDFDNDGFLDILGLGGNFLFNNGDMTFTFWDISPINGAIGDINNDGFLDILNNQLQVNDGNDNNWIKMNMVGTVSNLNGIGAMVHLYSPDFGVQTRQVRAGDGFRYMSSLNLHFGFGESTVIDSVVVDWPSGIQNVITDIEINTVLNIVEEDQNPDGLAELISVEMKMYPNPAEDVVYLELPLAYESMTYSIYDITGKKLVTGNVARNQINVSKLPSGTYVLSVDVDGVKAEKTLIKK